MFCLGVVDIVSWIWLVLVCLFSGIVICVFVIYGFGVLIWVGDLWCCLASLDTICLWLFVIL